MTAAPNDSLWRQLLGVFAPLSLLSIGGGQAILGDLQKQVVVNHHWLTQAQFLDDFAISRASAGPNTMIVTLIGWQVDGLAGAFATSLAIFVPSSLLFYALTQLWRLRAFGEWPNRIGRALAPVSVGLSLGGAWSILVAQGADPMTWIVCGAATAILVLTKAHPFALLAGGAVIFAGKALVGL